MDKAEELKNLKKMENLTQMYIKLFIHFTTIYTLLTTMTY
jgi:hypothetical protein